MNDSQRVYCSHGNTIRFASVRRYRPACANRWNTRATAGGTGSGSRSADEKASAVGGSSGVTSTSTRAGLYSRHNGSTDDESAPPAIPRGHRAGHQALRHIRYRLKTGAGAAYAIGIGMNIHRTSTISRAMLGASGLLPDQNQVAQWHRLEFHCAPALATTILPDQQRNTMKCDGPDEQKRGFRNLPDNSNAIAP